MKDPRLGRVLQYDLAKWITQDRIYVRLYTEADDAEEALAKLLSDIPTEQILLFYERERTRDFLRTQKDLRELKDELA